MRVYFLCAQHCGDFFLVQHLLGGLCPAPSIVFSSVCCVLQCVVYSVYGVLNVVSSVVTSV